MYDTGVPAIRGSSRYLYFQLYKIASLRSCQNRWQTEYFHDL